MGKVTFLASFAVAFVLGCSRPGGSNPDPSARAATVTSGPAVPELVSGVGIGPVRIGMTRAELDALALPTTPGRLKDEVLVGSYVASVRDDRVIAVHVELRALPGGARIGGSVFEAVTATIDAIAAKLPGCGQVHHNVGADLIYCDGGRTALVAGGPPGIITLEVYAPSRAAEILDRELGRGGSPHAPRALTKVFLIAADGTPEAKEAKGGAVVGCGDALVGVRIDTAAGTETDRLKVALETLFAADVKAPYSTAMKKNTMKVVRVAKDERGVFEVELAGRPAFGGTCDVPRFKGQVEQTAAQFGKAAIKLNGSEKDWRCAGDVSDSCK